MVCGRLFIFVTLLLPNHLSASSTRVKDKESLKGTVLRISAHGLEPFMKPVRHGSNLTYTGMTVTLGEILAEYFGMRYVPIPTDELLKNGAGVASGHLLAKNEIDLTNFPLAMNLQNFVQMDLSFPWWIEKFTMLQPFPEEQSRLVAPIRPFTNTVWLVFLLSAVMFVGVMSLMMMSNRQRTGRLDQENILSVSLDSIYRGIVYVFTIITSQGNYIPYGSPLSTKILTGTWILAMIVVINAYAGLLTAYLSVPKLVPIVETLEDLANRPGWSITVYRNNDLANRLLNASSGYFKVLGDQLRRNPGLLTTENYQILNNVVQRQCVYPTAITYARYYVNRDLQSSGRCRTTTSIKPLEYMTAYCLGYQKNSHITELANQRFMPRVWQMGLLINLAETFLPVTDRCRVDVPPKTKTSSLKLGDFMGAFVLLGIGFGLSTICFVMELVFGPSVQAKNEF